MTQNKASKQFDKTLLSNVKKEMAQPRIAKSARKEGVNKIAVRIVREATQD
jgi:hypothetical protein